MEDSDVENNQEGSVNIKNITPNIARKLLVFLYSDECKQVMHRLYPDLGKGDISRIRSFIKQIKNKIGNAYLGKKDLMKLWHRDNRKRRNPRFY